MRGHLSHWCCVCNEHHEQLSKRKFSQKRLVSRAPGLFSAYYVGSTLLRNFHPPSTSDQVVDGDGRAFSPKTGYQYLGYVCSAFQRMEVTSHHIDKSTRQASNKRAAVELQREASGMTRASGAKDLAEQHQSDLTEQCAQFHLEREQLLLVVRASEARANAARRSQA